MQVIDRLENLANGLRRILLRKLAVIANSIEQLSTSGQLCHNVEFVLDLSDSAISDNCRAQTHLGLEPVNKGDDVRMLKLLKHLKFVVDHVLISANILLQDDLDCDFLSVLGLGFPDDTVGASTQRASELVQGPKGRQK